MLAIITFIIILGVLIFVHELGHFVIARRNGIRADEFGFGFPPRIFGIQFISGKKREKFSEIESVETERIDVRSGNQEIIKETITEKVHNVSRTVPVRKWRIIWGKHDGDDTNEKKDLDEAAKNRYAGSTIYSLNWIPLGGFVRIKGEDGDNRDKDSFAVKSAWTRTKVLAAGVVMNFVLAWFLISLALMVGAPQPVDSSVNPIPDSKIQVSELNKCSPAIQAGIKVGDEILKNQTDSSGEKVNLNTLKDVQDHINSQKGKKMDLMIKRGNQVLDIKVTPRADAPQGQGPLGISLAETAIVNYPWYQSIYKGFIATADLIVTIIVAFGGIIKSLFVGAKIGAEISGPVGIAILTGQVTALGLVYVLQFAAILSVNLGIINALPIPALDGGRILFIIIEKIKGYPVSQKTEQMFHTTFFMLLILLMVVVTFKDVTKSASDDVCPQEVVK